MTFDLTQVTRGQLDAQLREEWKIMVDKKRVKWINKALEEQVKYVVGLLINSVTIQLYHYSTLGHL